MRIPLGEFGIVYRGQLLDARRVSQIARTGAGAMAGMVAVKTLKGNCLSLIVPSPSAIERSMPRSYYSEGPTQRALNLVYDST